MNKFSLLMRRIKLIIVLTFGLKVENPKHGTFAGTAGALGLTALDALPLIPYLIFIYYLCC